MKNELKTKFYVKFGDENNTLPSNISGKKLLYINIIQ